MDSVYRVATFEPEFDLDDMSFDPEFNLDDMSFDPEFDVAVNTQGDVVPYTGDYIVDPDFATQILGTKEKYMLDDVTVNPIEVARVSNPAGGRTIYIGGEING